MDHLRAALVILVVLHHVALVYGAAEPSFYYVEPPFDDPGAFLILLAFVLSNQAWFMGAFFLLAGYFTPGSFDRKGVGPFLRERLLRLGVPIIAFVLVLNPLSSIGYFLMPASLTGITAPLTWQAYLHLLGLGPLWFVAMLLIFTFGYAAWRRLSSNRASSSPSAASLPAYLQVAVFVLALALANYLIRFVVPLGKPVSLFVDFLSFPTIAYLPQYLSFFILGIIAFRRGWLRALPKSAGAVGITSVALAGIFLFPLAFSGRLFSLELTQALNNAFGSGHWQSAVYALWDSITAVGLCLALIPIFRQFLDRSSRFGAFLSRHSYAVYIIHIPIIVFLAFALRGIELAALPKFAMASALVVPACFIVAFVLRKIPGASRIF